jgi:hypothetical protein
VYGSYIGCSKVKLPFGETVRHRCRRCVRSANGTGNPHVMAGDLERWAKEAETDYILKARKSRSGKLGFTLNELGGSSVEA